MDRNGQKLPFFVPPPKYRSGWFLQPSNSSKNVLNRQEIEWRGCRKKYWPKIRSREKVTTFFWKKQVQKKCFKKTSEKNVKFENFLKILKNIFNKKSRSFFMIFFFNFFSTFFSDFFVFFWFFYFSSLGKCCSFFSITNFLSRFFSYNLSIRFPVDWAHFWTNWRVCKNHPERHLGGGTKTRKAFVHSDFYKKEKTLHSPKNSNECKSREILPELGQIFGIFRIFGVAFAAPTGGTEGVARYHLQGLIMRYDKNIKMNFSRTKKKHVFFYVKIRMDKGFLFLYHHLNIAQDDSYNPPIRSKTCSIDRKSNGKFVGKKSCSKFRSRKKLHNIFQETKMKKIWKTSEKSEEKSLEKSWKSWKIRFFYQKCSSRFWGNFQLWHFSPIFLKNFFFQLFFFRKML